jgi:hypothetical protein
MKWRIYMFNSEFIKKLKQTNLSSNAGKTKTRLLQIWKSATRAQQAEIIELAGVARTAVHRSYKNGNISAKIAVPVAQVMNVSPFYLTGEADKPEECSQELMREFLVKYNYGALLDGAPAKQRKKKKSAAKKPKSAAKGKATKKAAPAAKTKAPAAKPVTKSEYNLTEDEMIILMKSILLRAKTGGKYAAVATELKKLLMS